MRKMLESIVVGIIFGLATHLVGKYLPDEWQFLIETKVIWLLPAFLMAFNLPSRRKATDSVIVATITLVTTGVVYYTTEVIKNNGGWYFTEDLGMFIIPAIIAGVITGYIAFLGRSATQDFIRYASVSLLPAIYTGQGIDDIINTINNFEITPEIVTKVIGGFVFYLLISGRNKFKPKSAASYLALTILAVLGVSLIP
jgi:hypothetical protein